MPISLFCRAYVSQGHCLFYQYLSIVRVFDFMIGGGLPQPNRYKSSTCKVFVPIDCFRFTNFLSVEILALWTKSLLGLVVF